MSRWRDHALLACALAASVCACGGEVTTKPPAGTTATSGGAGEPPVEPPPESPCDGFSSCPARPCQTGQFDYAACVCYYLALPAGTPCSVGVGIGTCDDLGDCIAGDCDPNAPSSTCDDLEECTTEACGPANECIHTPIDGGPAPGVVQIAGNCMLTACAQGSTVEQIDDTDVPYDANPCTVDVCMGGQPYHPPAPNGTLCGANMVCTMGVCVSL